MTFRARLLIGSVAVTALPLLILGGVVREQLTTRLTAQYQARVRDQARVASQDLARQDSAIAGRLETLAQAATTDDRLRLALLRGSMGDREYLLDWATNAMRVSGLEMLQLQDPAGRIVSSGHFRNEFDRLEPGLPTLLGQSLRAVLVQVRAPEGPFLALVRTAPVRIAGRRYALVGGVKVDDRFLAWYARDEGTQVALRLPGDSATPPPPNALSSVVNLPMADLASSPPALTTARLELVLPTDELQSLVRGVERWFSVAMVIALAVALSLAWWMASRLSGPVSQLTQAASTMSLEGLGAPLPTDRDDEIGVLARRFSHMASRLRTAANKLRVAERRATMGEMARQVNHDVRNGLIPIRNVLRHLAQVEREQPANLPAIFAERRATLESSVDYLEALARNYAKLAPRTVAQPVDVNTVVRAVAGSLGDGSGFTITVRLSPVRPMVLGDPVAVRRILENLMHNAVESLPGREGDGVVKVQTETSDGMVRLEVADNGIGMTEEARARAFDDFFTTKPEGTGLGLSVVRRLVMDLGGTASLTSAPGVGTTVTVALPLATTPHGDGRVSREPARTARAGNASHEGR